MNDSAKVRVAFRDPENRGDERKSAAKIEEKQGAGARKARLSISFGSKETV